MLALIPSEESRKALLMKLYLRWLEGWGGAHSSISSHTQRPVSSIRWSPRCLTALHTGVPFLEFLTLPGVLCLLAQTIKSLPVMQEAQARSLGQDDPLQKQMATHSSIPAWRIPRTEEPGRLQPMGVTESDTTEQLHFHFCFLPCLNPSLIQFLATL